MKFAKYFAMMTSGLMMAWGAGSCLPDDFWAGKVGEITNGMIVNGLDFVLVPLLGFGPA